MKDYNGNEIVFNSIDQDFFNQKIKDNNNIRKEKLKKAAPKESEVQKTAEENQQKEENDKKNKINYGNVNKTLINIEKEIKKSLDVLVAQEKNFRADRENHKIITKHINNLGITLRYLSSMKIKG